MLFSCVINNIPNCEFSIFLNDEKIQNYKINNNFISLTSPIKNGKHNLKLYIDNISPYEDSFSDSNYVYIGLCYTVYFNVQEDYSALQIDLEESNSFINNKAFKYCFVGQKRLKHLKIINEEYSFPNMSNKSILPFLQNIIKTWINK